MESFEDASEFLEKFLLNFGIGENRGDQYFPPSGELLFQAYQSFHKIEEAINAKEPEIIKRLGDRREKFESDRSPPMAKLPGLRYLPNIGCVGRSSHSCGLCVMLNLLGIVEQEIEIDTSADWKTLTKSERQRIAQCEQSFNPWGGAIMLADGVNYERTAVQSNRRSLSASTVDRDRLKFYEERKVVSRLTYKQAAELWNKQERDFCDEGSFKQSCYRARKKVTT